MKEANARNRAYEERKKERKKERSKYVKYWLLRKKERKKEVE